MVNIPMRHLAPECVIALFAPVAVRVVAIGPVLRHLRGAGSVRGAEGTLSKNLFFVSLNLLVLVRFRLCLAWFTVFWASLPLVLVTPIDRTWLVSLCWK